MNCAEFQKVLPYIIETGGNAEQEEHLRSCTVCSDLVADLKYIAEQAKLLLPMMDPSPRVWEGIRGALEREGVRPSKVRLLDFGSWRPVPWLAAVAAVVLIALGVAIYRRGPGARESAANTSTPAVAPAAVADADDQQLLSAVADDDPDLRATFAEGLRKVNASIAEARSHVEQNPDDDEARQYLVQAYGQKAMLYDMANGAMN